MGIANNVSTAIDAPLADAPRVPVGVARAHRGHRGRVATDRRDGKVVRLRVVPVLLIVENRDGPARPSNGVRRHPRR